MSAWKVILGTMALFTGGALIQDHRRPESPLRKTPHGPVVMDMSGNEHVLVIEQIEWISAFLRLGARRPAISVMIQGKTQQYTMDIPTALLFCPEFINLTMDDGVTQVWVNPKRVVGIESAFYRISDAKETSRLTFDSGSELNVVQEVDIVCSALGRGCAR